jgi:hypothetical protein
VIGWIVLAVIVVSVGVLALAARSVVRRLPALQQAQADLQGRVADVERLQERLGGLQGQSAVLQEKVVLVQARLADISAKRVKKGQEAS